MDSDVTADSLSSPELGGTSVREGGSGFRSMLSFSTQGPADRASSQRSSSAALDSFDLSPATDASTGGGGFLDGGSRHQRSSLSLHESGGLTREGGGGCGDGGRRNSIRAGRTASGNDAPLSGGTGETFSVVSEVSSGGLPAPPVLPSGPLPAIGTIREYFLTGQQQNRLNHERRLTADHMRRLNQVLAGHLSYLEVSKVHADRENLLAAAPSHGSAVGYASSLDGEEDSQGRPRRVSRRQTFLRRLVARVARERTRDGLTKGWFRMSRYSTWVAARLATADKPISSGTAVMERRRGEGTREAAAAVEDRHSGSTKDHALDRKQQGLKIVDRVYQNRCRRAVFHGWSRLCLHAASLSAAEGGLVASTAIARAARAEAMEKEAEAAAKKAGACRRAAAASAQVAEASKKAPRLSGVSSLTAELQRRGEDADQVMREQQLRRMKMLITRVCGERDRALIFRGWSRLCLHAASLSAAEGASASATAVARAIRAEAMEKEAAAATEKAEAWRRAAAASAEVAEAREKAQREASRGSVLASELHQSKREMEQVVRQQQLRRMKMRITRLCGERDRALLFRGWNSLCLQASSVASAEGESASAMAFAKAARAEAMGMVAESAASRLEAAAADEEKQLASRRSMLKTQLKLKVEGTEQIDPVCFVAGVVLCLHAASLSAAEGASAAARAAARATRAEATRLEAVAAADKIKALETKPHISNGSADSGERAQQGPSGEVMNEMIDEMGTLQRALKTERWRRADMLIGRICGARDRSLMFRGWSRLCLHAASLSAAEGGSAAATAIARAARAEAMEKEAEAAAHKAEACRRAAAASAQVAEAREKARRLSTGVLSLTAELQRRDEDVDQVMREQQLRRMKMLIARVCGERDRALIFRGWSRLCLQAASLSAAEGASASATAVARAVRAEAMEKEAAAAVEKAEAWRRAAAASAEVAEAREKAQREASRGSVLASELHQSKREMENVVRQQQLRRMKMLITRVCGERDRALLFRGWSRLSLHAASLSAAEGASATATAVARVARGEALEKEAAFASSRAEAAVAREEVRQANSRGSMLETELETKGNHVEKVMREHQLRRMKILIIRVCGERDRALMFRGWSRLCLHAASLSAAEGASAAATAVAVAARAEAATDNRADVVERNAKEHARRADEMEKRAAAVEEQFEALGNEAVASERALEATEKQKAVRLITRMAGDGNRRLLFRGWSRLCLHAASLNAAEGTSSAATAAARAARAAAEEDIAAAAISAIDAVKSDASKEQYRRDDDLKQRRAKAVGASAAATAVARAARAEAVEKEADDAADPRETAAATRDGRRVEGKLDEATMAMSAALERAEKAEEALQKQGGKLISRILARRDARLLFRGWSRICMHAGSLNAAEGSIAAATATARARRADAIEKEAQATAENAEAWRKVAAANPEMAAVKEHAQRQEKWENMVREQQKRRVKELIIRMCREKEKATLFRGWSRLCLHAASLSAAEGASAAARAAARATRAEATRLEAVAAADKIKALETKPHISNGSADSGERAQQGPSGEVMNEMIDEMGTLQRALKTERWRRADMLIGRICGARDRSLMFRGWSRLCLHAASLSAAEGGSAAATAIARAARAEAMEKEAEAAAHKAEACRRAAAASAQVAEAREKARRLSTGVLSLTAELQRRDEDVDQVMREQQLRRMKMLIARVCGERDRALIFRGWSRLCLQAASLSAAEGASASATAVARAVRAEAMEKEAAAAVEKAEAWRRAAAASAEVAEAREKAQREASRGSVLASELHQSKREMENVVRQQQLRRMKMLITRVCGERDRALLFRGWSRLSLHAASLSAAEGASATATAVARVARGEALEKEAAFASSRAEAAVAREEVRQANSRGSMLETELETKGNHVEKVMREHQLRRMKILIIRVCGERDRALMFRGWSRLCLHAASLSAAEGASAADTAVAGAARAEAMEKDAEATAQKPEASERAAATDAEMTSPRKEAQYAADKMSALTAELKRQEESAEQAAREHQLSRVKGLVVRMFGERERALMFRGWSRLCLHAASLSAAEGASASATAAARAARAEAMEKEAEAAAAKAEAWRRAAVASAEVAKARENAQREASRGSVLMAELKLKDQRQELVLREQQLRRTKMLIIRVCGERDRALMFRGWSRLCLHAASLSAAEGASAADTAVAGAARAEAMEKDSGAAAHKAEASERAAATDAEMTSPRKEAQYAADKMSALTAELKRQEESAEQAAREHQLSRVKGLVVRMFGERERALMFRGWSRLCLHAASLSAAEGASASATAAARAARAEAMEKEAEAAAAKAEAWRRAAVASAEVAKARENAQREASRGSVLMAELKLKDQRQELVLREQQLRRTKMLIIRVCGERYRALIFRAWSRLCLHAASLSAAEGASASATAVARAARAAAMEKEAEAAAEKAEAWRRAAAASAQVAEARETAQREAARGSVLMTELHQRKEETQEVLRQKHLRRVKMLITRLCSENDRALMFRGWSRLCLHAATFSAAEGASAAAMAFARAARAEAMDTGSEEAAGKAETRGRSASASAEAAEEEDKAQGGTDEVSTTAALKEKGEHTARSAREQQAQRMKRLITRVCGDKDRLLMFRGWSRLCLHAASLSAAEGASASATAVARAARAEAMEKEAAATAEKAEAWRRAAAASAEVAEAREKALREAARGSSLAAELHESKEEMQQVARHQQLRRLKILTTRVCGERNRALLFRGWSRLCLHAASLSAAEGASAAATAFARAARAEAMEMEADAAAATAVAKAAEAKAAERKAIAAANAAAEQMEGVDLVRRRTRAILMLQRLSMDKNRQRLWRAWRSLCEHTAAACAADAAIASATTESSKRLSLGGQKDSCPLRTDSVTAPSMTENEAQLRRKLLLKTVLRFALRAERQAIARGWARLSAATATGTTSAAFAEGAQKMEMMEAYVVDLQQQAVRRGRELDRKTRALTILLRDDWATAALEREQETRAARLQLAQAEADLAAQIDRMAGVVVRGSRRRVHEGQASGQFDGHAVVRGSVTGGEGNGGETVGEEAEVFLGGAGGGIGMVALQGEGARRLREYVAGKGRDLKRARLEAQEWRARCGTMQSRVTNLLSIEGLGDSPFAGGKGLAGILLSMLDERDRRLSNLYKDLASLSAAGYSGGVYRSKQNDGGRRREARRQAGELLLRHMKEAGDEARVHIHRLSHEVQQLQTALGVLRAPAHKPEQLESGLAQVHEGKDEFQVNKGGEFLAEVPITAACGGGVAYPTAAVEYGVQSAIDAHELVFSLRSEVSALERHAANLQANLDHLENSSAATVDQATIYASWVARTTGKTGAGPKESSRANNADDENPVEEEAVAATPTIAAGHQHRKRERSERRKRAAAILQRTLGDFGGGAATVMPFSEALSEDARAVELAREARQRAQDNLISRNS
eukprot:g13665.t1